jgi:hypothetical protein
VAIVFTINKRKENRRFNYMEDLLVINGVEYVKVGSKEETTLDEEIILEALRDGNLELTDVTGALQDYLKEKLEDSVAIDSDDLTRRNDDDSKNAVLLSVLYNIFHD